MLDSPPFGGRLIDAAVRNCGEAYAFAAARMGRPSTANDRYVAGDLGLPVTAPANNATLLSRPEPTEVSPLVDELRQFFSGPGGGWQVWSIWPDVDLSAQGLVAGTVPCMLRLPGGQSPSPPPELVVVEVEDDRARVDMETVVLTGYGIPGVAAGELYALQVFGDIRYRSWVGYVDGRPVSTATAYVGAGLVGVYIVATVPDARGHGYGEALSWAATLSAPELPATLQASSMGQPVYERMGYQVAATFTVWVSQTRD